ncbi:ankyrin repeat-containing domain protein [Hyaloscypha sp. PMI_1271]|nr:ankyrin repeat-containing domain protein [Hyaloscypha sp. PMI_1271]
MSHSFGSSSHGWVDASPQGWEKFKNVIRGLYIVKGHKLEGPNGVIKLMESQYGFKATKAQYEKKFKEWGFQKNHTKDDWKIVGQKVGLRKRTAKESNVYLDGELMPRKRLQREISRHFMSVTEQFKTTQALETPPATPPGFDIRTPIARPAFRLVFENLPIFQFQEAIPPLVESIRSFDTSLTALAPFLGKTLQTDQNDSSMPIIDSLFPNSAFLEEACAQGLAIKRLEKFGPVEFLNLSTFMISNNFPGETNGEQVYKWLKRHGSTNVLKAIATTKGPTGEALLENLFRLAIEAEDIPIAKRLIEAGVDPNGHICRHPRIPDHMNPLQYACIRGNSELALELINAGSSIDQPGTGWKSSALVLAIIGEYLRDHRDFWEYGKEKTQAGDDQDLEIPSACFLDLIYSLVEKGAAINPIIDRSSPTLQYWNRDKTSNLDTRLDSVMKDGHSPLTAASKYRNEELVNFFLQRGADQDFLTQRDTCALRECLFSWEQTELHTTDASEGYTRTLSERVSIFPGSESLSKIIGVARSLIDAEVDVDKHFLWCPQEEDDEEYKHFHTEEEGCYLSTLDLSVLTESVELVDMMLCAGATTFTEYSLEQATKTGSLEMVNVLLSADAPLSSLAVRNAIRQDEWGDDRYIKTLLRQRSGFITQTKLLHEAIRLGNDSILKHIFDYGDFKGGKFVRALEGLEGALEDCCGSGYIGTLRLIIDECSKYNVSIAPHLGGSLGRAILKEHDDIADTLLLAGADVNAFYSGRPALMIAIEGKHRKMVLKLIDANSILSTETEDDESIYSNCVDYHEVAGDPLIMAIEWDDDFVVEKLLDAGASMDALGHSAAIRSQNSDLVETLISKGANPYDRHALKEATALHSWNEPPDDEEVGDEALASAMEKQDREIIRALLDSSLMRINPIRRLSQALLRALDHVSTPNLEIIRMVLGHGADPNTVWKFNVYNNDIFFSSPLCTAIKWNNLEQLKILLDAGGKPDSNLTCGMYDSPMQFAASCRRVDMVRILLEAGSDPNVVAVPKENVRKWDDLPKRDNGTPLQIAVSNQDIETIRLLQQYNGNPNGIFGNMPHTPLQMACRDGSKETVELLLELGAEVNAPPAKNFGATALQFAAIKGLLGIAHLLLEYGADVNAPPAEVGGRTALEGAAEHGRIDMVQLLLNAGSNIFQEGEEAQYESAIRRASQNGHHAVRRLLESYHG